MDATVAAGWIGAGAALVGAVVGAGGAIVGGWFQHRQQTKADQQKVIDERRQAAGNKALTQMFALRSHILQWGPGLDPDIRFS
jgi:Na+/glutamate symporter